MVRRRRRREGEKEDPCPIFHTNIWPSVLNGRVGPEVVERRSEGEEDLILIFNTNI